MKTVPQFSYDPTSGLLALFDPAGMFVNIPIDSSTLFLADFLAQVSDPTAALNGAIATFNANPNFSRIVLPPGIVTFGSTLTTITRQVAIEGQFGSELRAVADGVGGLSVDTPSRCKFSDFRVTSYSAPGTSTGLHVFGGNFGSEFDGMEIVGFNEGVSIDGAAWSWNGGYIVDWTLTGILIDNGANPDTGDSSIDSGLKIDTGKTSPYDGTNPNTLQAGIRQHASGGLRIGSIKVLHGDYGYLMQLSNGASTSILNITGGSYEKQNKANIGLTHMGATGSFSLVSIIGNELGIAPRCVHVFGSRSFLANVTIDGNTGSNAASGSEARRLFDINQASAVYIGKGNNIAASGAANHTVMGSATSGCTVMIGLGSGAFTQRYVNQGAGNYFEPKNYDLGALSFASSAVTTTAMGSLYRSLATVNWPEQIDVSFPKVSFAVEDFSASPQGTPLVSAFVSGMGAGSGTIAMVSASSPATIKVRVTMTAVPIT
jgi:hypothetical protein